MTPGAETPVRPRDIRRFFDDVESMMRVPFRERWATFAPLFAGEPWTHAVDVIEKDTAIIVKADLPGMKREDIALTVDQGMLTIRAERKQEEDVKKGGYHRTERSYGRFERTLPFLGAAGNVQRGAHQAPPRRQHQPPGKHYPLRRLPDGRNGSAGGPPAGPHRLTATRAHLWPKR